MEAVDESLAPEQFYSGQLNVAARSPDRFVPPDQMRWLVAGLCAMVLAGVFLYLDLRLQVGTAKILLVPFSKRRSPASRG